MTDVLDKLWDEYDDKYQAMADVKRLEDVNRRKMEKDIQKYKNEKRRPIPSWPSSIPYSKFKPDLLSWDRENYLSTGAFKFGQMVEMLKKEGRINTFEQIQTRLGRVRDDSKIISKIVDLLDAVNEETCYNKLSKTWDLIINLRKSSTETLNEFFSRYETLQFSLNNADDSYSEPPPDASAETKDLMANRKVEMNDKLKAVILLKALGIDENQKRDVLAKVDFNKEPN